MQIPRKFSNPNKRPSHDLLKSSKILCNPWFITGKGLICCGDDKGSLWLYNLPQFGKDTPNPALKTKIDVSTRLMWPELQDDHLENSRKVPLDRHDIIIDKVAASHDNNFVVAVTSNNMVCIWKRVSENEQASSSNS